MCDGCAHCRFGFTTEKVVRVEGVNRLPANSSVMVVTLVRTRDKIASAKNFLVCWGKKKKVLTSEIVSKIWSSWESEDAENTMFRSSLTSLCNVWFFWTYLEIRDIELLEFELKLEQIDHTHPVLYSSLFWQSRWPLCDVHAFDVFFQVRLHSTTVFQEVPWGDYVLWESTCTINQKFEHLCRSCLHLPFAGTYYLRRF